MNNHYNIIADKEELWRFFNLILPELNPLEGYFISLSARNKYLSQEEKEKLSLGRTEMFSRKIVRKKDFNKFISTLRKYECAIGGYITKTGEAIPQKCMVVYINLNPTHALKAYKEFNKTMNEYIYELATVSSEERKETNICERINKMYTLMQNCYQKSRSKKYYMDIDFDIPKECFMPTLLNSFLLEKGIESFYWIDTKSGYHLVIPTKFVKFNPQEIVDAGILTFKKWCITNDINIKNIKWEIVNNKNLMIPICGCYQANYPVKVLWEYSYKEEQGD